MNLLAPVPPLPRSTEIGTEDIRSESGDGSPWIAVELRHGCPRSDENLRVVWRQMHQLEQPQG